jgi:SSS family solute:Na+ symporter
MTVATGLAVALAVYLALMFGLALFVRDKVNDEEDFLVAGRRLPLSLAWATLFATWFGAGTLLASADEIRATGLRAVAMEPLGAGLCLVLAGLFFARPLWRLKLLTLADFYRDRFGRRAEVWFALGTVTYFGWIAAQLVGVAGIMEVFFGWPLWAGILGAAAVAMVYTLIGGMWSVTLTDAAQIVILIVGLAMVVFNVLDGLGGDAGLAAGLNALVDGVPADHLVLVPTDRLGDLFDWINLLVIGSLGNLAGADLMQRVFSSKSEKVAQQACLFAGAAYIVVGVAPALLGLAAQALLPADVDTAVLPRLAAQVLSPTLVVLFVLALLSAVLSTLDSAILTAASVFAHNVLGPHMKPGTAMMKVTQACVVATTLVSVAFAFAGESAFSLLEGSYALTLAGPFVVLVFGLFWRRGDERAAVASLVLGYAITLAEMIWPDIDLGVPVPLVALAISAVVYVALALARPAPTA